MSDAGPAAPAHLTVTEAIQHLRTATIRADCPRCHREVPVTFEGVCPNCNHNFT